MTEYERQVKQWKRKQAIIDWLVIALFFGIAFAAVKMVP